MTLSHCRLASLKRVSSALSTLRSSVAMWVEGGWVGARICVKVGKDKAARLGSHDWRDNKWRLWVSHTKKSSRGAASGSSFFLAKRNQYGLSSRSDLQEEKGEWIAINKLMDGFYEWWMNEWIDGWMDDINQCLYFSTLPLHARFSNE